MYIVKNLRTSTVHIVESRDSYSTLCGKKCQSNVVNNLNYGFATIKNIKDILNVPKITCKKCITINNKKNTG